MSVVRAIAFKDWREFVRDRRLTIMALLTVMLALAAIATSTARVSAYETDRRAADTYDRATWLGQGPRNPHMAGHFGQWAFRPMTAGSLLDPGVEPYAGEAVWLEAHVRDTPMGRPLDSEVGGALFGQFSAAWVLQTIAPLLLAVVAAGLVARERETGALRLILATGTDAAAIIPGKLLGLGLIALCVVLPVLLATMLTAYLIAPGAADLGRLLLWALSYMLFFGVVLSMALCVSAGVRTGSAATLCLLALWFVALVLVPRAGASLAETLAPTPSASGFWSTVSRDNRHAADAAGVEDQRFATAMLQRFRVRSVSQLPLSLTGLRLDAGEAVGNGVYKQNFDRLAQLYQRHRIIMRWTGVLSPIVALQNVSMALAGTDDAHQRAFEVQAEAHREDMMRLLNGDFAQHAGKTGFDYLAGGDLWRRVGSFTFRTIPLGEVLDSIWPDLLVLMAWGTASTVLLAFASRRLMREAN